MNFLGLFLVVLLSYYSWGQDGVRYIRVGEEFSIKFTSYNIGGCSDELGFSRENDSVFKYSEAIDFRDLGQYVKLKIKVGFDSVNVSAGYYNRYGILYSETEGAYIYYDKDPLTFLFSGWRQSQELTENHKFNLKFFGSGKGFVNNAPPEIAKKVVKSWCKEQEWCPMDKPVTVFCTDMTIRVSIHLNGLVKNYYLLFERRVGEC